MTRNRPQSCNIYTYAQFVFLNMAHTVSESCHSVTVCENTIYYAALPVQVSL